MAKTVALFFLFATVALAASVSCAQSTDPRPLLPGREDSDSRPKTVEETLEKMRIDKDKKDHEQMVTRGEEVLKLTEQIEKSYASNGKLSGDDYSKIANVEKLVKKIRDELGGDGDTDDDKDDNVKLTTTASGMKSLRDMTSKMIDELKKTTRFSISLCAIQTTNAVLRIARFLKGGN